MCLLSRSYSTTSLPRLLGTWWEGGGKTNLCHSVWFSSGYLTLSSRSDSSFVSAATQAFQASRMMNLTSLFSFPAAHKALNSSQQEAGWASVSLGGRLEKTPHKLSIPFACLESGFLFQVQESEIDLIKNNSYMPRKKHTFSIPRSKTIKTPLEKREGEYPELPLISLLKSQVSLDEIQKSKQILMFFLSKSWLLNFYSVVCSDFSGFSKATLFSPYFPSRQ